MSENEKLSLVLFSGTADKLQAAAIMASGAAAMGVETHIFLTFWGLNAFRKVMEGAQLPMSADAGDMGDMAAKLMQEKGVQPWSEVLAMAKEVGDVHVHACSMTMDLFELTMDDMVDIVDDQIGVATFIGQSSGGNILFI